MQELPQSEEGKLTTQAHGAIRTITHALLFFMAVCIVTTGAAVYFYSQTVSLRNPQAITQEKIQELVDKVSMHIVLPVGEIPTVATINDLEVLKTQPFFMNAEVGDMLLVYEGARKAIIYSPSKDRIVEVGPVTSAPAPDAKK